mmetsp:Transcript_79900/g.209835  ORF Transcript_79900/g.209835 Transcript_79900/m.209835 type:complete len:212 (-) Transcript_79900:655-1290(-)
MSATCMASAPTMHEAMRPMRCSVQRLEESRAISHWRFRWRAPWNFRKKCSSRPKAWMVDAPESVSSMLWNMGLFVIIHQRMVSRLDRRCTSRIATKTDASTTQTGAHSGRATITSANMSMHCQEQMQNTSSTRAAVQSTSIWSSPSRFMMRPDGVRSKKEVGQWRTLWRRPLWMDEHARIVRTTQRTRLKSVARLPATQTEIQTERAEKSS